MNQYQEGGPAQGGAGLQQVYNVLSKMGMVNMPFEQFSQLPQDQIQAMAMKAQQALQQKQQGRQMQEGGEVTEEDPLTSTSNESMNGSGGNALVKGLVANAAPTAIGAIGAGMIDSNKPDTLKTQVGTVMQSAGAMGTAMAPLGPVGMAVGAGLGAVKGIFDARQAKKAYKEDLSRRSQPREVGTLGTSYNPDAMRYGGDVQSMEAAIAKNRKYNPFTNYGPKGPDTEATDLPVTEQMYYGGNVTAGSLRRRMRMQAGGPVQKMGDGRDADVEIEGGEAVYSKQGNAENISIQGGAQATNASSKGFMADGAQHGEMNAAGTEGIPMKVDDPNGAYVGSDKLGVDGRKASSSNPSVASAMKPYLAYLEDYENSKDKFGNNPKAISTVENELDRISKHAEMGKSMAELEKLLKSRGHKNIQETHNKMIELLGRYPGKDDLLTGLTGKAGGGDKENATNEQKAIENSNAVDPNSVDPNTIKANEGMTDEESAMTMQGAHPMEMGAPQGMEDPMNGPQGMPGIPTGQGDAVQTPVGRTGGHFRPKYRY